MTECLMTGATGFLGTNLTLELARLGWSVRALGLPDSETRYIRHPNVKVIYGDITKPEEIDEAVKGVEVVFHVAGDTSFWKRNYKRQNEINIQGSANVARACVAHGVRRLVHTGTSDIFGHNPDGAIDESWTGYSFAGMGFNYADSKREGEKRVRSEAGDKLEVVVIYPGALMGAYDFTLQYGRLFFDLRDGKVPGVPAGGTSLANVREVANAHISAAIKGRAGEGYICAGVNISYREMFEAMAEKFGRHAPRLTLPPALLTLYGYVEEWLALFTGKPPQLDPGMARYMSVTASYDSGKAIRELDYVIPSLEETIDEAYEWYRGNGFL